MSSYQYEKLPPLSDDESSRSSSDLERQPSPRGCRTLGTDVDWVCGVARAQVNRRRFRALIGLVVVMLVAWPVMSRFRFDLHIVAYNQNDNYHPLSPLTSLSPTFHPHSSPPRPIDIASSPLPPSTPLSARLAAWSSAPHNASLFSSWNTEACRSESPNMMRSHTGFWRGFGDEEVMSAREELVGAMTGLEIDGKLVLPRNHKGRGIVFAGGYGNTLSQILISVRLMHRRGLRLPVVIAHFPGEIAYGDISKTQKQELDILGIRFMEVQGAGEKTTMEGSIARNYHLKVEAVVEAPFEEVLYMDVDVVAVRDPTYLFEAPGYKRLGALFMPDYWRTSPDNPIHRILGVKCRDEFEFESGAFVINKSQHLDVLQLAQLMLQRSSLYYHFTYGDKDSFRFAFLALRKRWAVPGRMVSAAGGLQRGGKEVCSSTMLQHDPWGKPLFIHYNCLKLNPETWRRGHTFGGSLQIHPRPPPSTSHSAPEQDGNTDCDMLADSDLDGVARAPAPEDVRWRARAERGLMYAQQLLCGYYPVWNGLSRAENPIEKVIWADDPDLRGIENELYDMGFHNTYSNLPWWFFGWIRL